MPILGPILGHLLVEEHMERPGAVLERGSTVRAGVDFLKTDRGSFPEAYFLLVAMISEHVGRSHRVEQCTATPVEQ
jgi:hypothetical protein